MQKHFSGTKDVPRNIYCVLTGAAMGTNRPELPFVLTDLSIHSEREAVGWHEMDPVEQGKVPRDRLFLLSMLYA